MHRRSRVGLLALAFATLAFARPVGTAGPPTRRSLDSRERDAVLSLLTAVDLAQDVDAKSDAGLAWDSHVLKAGDEVAYVPFRLTLSGVADGFTSTAMYVRVVSRRDGVRVSEERSFLREWVLHGGGAVPRRAETVYVGPGEFPVGLAAGSTRPSVSGPGAASAALALQERQYEKQRTAAAEAKTKQEAGQRDPLIFPFEEYYFYELKTSRAGEPRSVERALSLPPGEYDVFVALVDRGRLKTSSPTILKRTITVPDFWNDRLALSSLILSKDVHPLKAPLAAPQQAEHPYALGQTEVVPVLTPSFSTDDALSVVFQVCNYGAPDSDLTLEYTFYRTDPTRRLFNRTEPQQYADADLPPPGMWSTQAFAMQTVPLLPFPPGAYELEITARDRLTRATAKETVAFTVVSGVR